MDKLRQQEKILKWCSRDGMDRDYITNEKYDRFNYFPKLSSCGELVYVVNKIWW